MMRSATSRSIRLRRSSPAGSNAGYHYTENTPASLSSTFNGLNQPTVIGGVSISHDARGNLTSDGTTTYGYDVNNRLVSGTGGTVLTYDANGRLIQTEKTSLATTQFLYAGDELIAEYDDSDDLQRRYVHGADIDDPIVWYEGDDTADRRWLLADERGSIIAVTDASGDALQINTYDAYGKPGTTNLGRFQYTGQTFISEVGLYHYKARFYSPDLGRFLQTDPIWYEDQTNLYGYVGNDPINKSDPTGLEKVDCTGSGSCPDPIKIEEFQEGDIILTVGATITVGENKKAEVTFNEGFEDGASAADAGPIIIPVAPMTCH